jgi:uncharacterized protein
VKRFWPILVSIWCLRAVAAEVIPPAPTRYFNDYARVVSPPVAEQLNQTLEDFERQSSDQILVAVFPKMQSDSSVEDYTIRVARAWKIGQKDRNNGAVLFVFVQDHKMFLQAGYGLEGVLPDALCKRIIDEQIAPRFKTGDFEGGLTAGVQSIMAAVKGEYKGTGQTVSERRHPQPNVGTFFVMLVFGLIAILLLFSLLRRFRTGAVWAGWTIASGGFSRGGGWGGGGGFSGGGGGGFSGGGGSFGGGGAGGGW